MQSLKRSVLQRTSDGSVCTRCLRLTNRIADRAPSLLVSTRQASTASEADLKDLDETSHHQPVTTEAWDPAEQASKRKSQLPPSSYQARPPKYYRGPLHPHQPPKPSDPASREYAPGPFSVPRMQQMWESTVSPDFMVMAYQHTEPGAEKYERAPRLREWAKDGSPYNVGRPLRGPRGGSQLRLLRKPITFRNIPRVERVTVHCFVNKVSEEGSAALHVAGMALQAMTGIQAKPHAAKISATEWGLKKGTFYALTADLRNEDTYHFLSRVVDIVMPRLKEWKGISATSGDGSGNISFGLTPEHISNFPEIEVNYDSYPPSLIPGAHVTIHTTAANDRDARLLLTGLGIPFHGNINHF